VGYMDTHRQHGGVSRYAFVKKQLAKNTPQYLGILKKFHDFMDSRISVAYSKRLG
jgi:hypothetical protein